MKKLSETYKELGIVFTFPIKIKDEKGNRTYGEDSDGSWWSRAYNGNGKVTYFENSNGFWASYEYDENGNQAYYETSDGFWASYEYDENGNRTYHETSEGYKEGTKRGSCDGKVVEIDGKKYKLTEL